MIYRVGGEEFLVLLPGRRPPQATAVAESLRAAVARARPCGLEITCSLGVSAAAGSEVSTRLIEAADAALYRVKAGGRNRVVTDATPAVRAA